MYWMKLLAKFVKILRDGQTPAQIAGGFALGSIIGFSSMFTLQGAVVWLIILVLNVNLTAAILGLTVCSLIAYIFDPLFHQLGYYLLVEVDALQNFWIMLYNAPIAPLTRFNNTVVLGSFVCAIIFFVPIYFGMKKFVIAYRATIGASVQKFKIYQILKSSSLYQWYERIRTLGDVL